MKVLVVDNDPRILRSLKAILEDEHKVITTDSIQQAKYLVLMNAVEPFDVIMSHERLPYDKGHKFMNWVSMNSQNSKRVMTISMPIKQELRDLLIDVDSISFMRKPWQPEEVRKVVMS